MQRVARARGTDLQIESSCQCAPQDVAVRGGLANRYSTPPSLSNRIISSLPAASREKMPFCQIAGGKFDNASLFDSTQPYVLKGLPLKTFCILAAVSGCWFRGSQNGVGDQSSIRENGQAKTVMRRLGAPKRGWEKTKMPAFL